MSPNFGNQDPNKQPADPTQRGRHVDQPTQEELVVQLQDPELNESGPNDQLRRHIEIFSRYGPLFRSLLHTLVGFIAYQFNTVYELNELPGALARAMRLLCIPLFAGICLGRALRSNGLAEKHFGWSPTLCSGLLKTIAMIVWVWLPLRFLYTALETFDAGQWNNSLGRFLFIIAMVAVTYGLWLSSRGLRMWLHEADDQTQHRQSRNMIDLLLWFLPALPASLAIMSAAGYHFTAVQMSWRALWTILLMVGIAMVGGFVGRLLLIAQFSIKFRQLSRDDEGEINSEESIDIGAISKQVNRLDRVDHTATRAIGCWHRDFDFHSQ